MFPLLFESEADIENKRIVGVLSDCISCTVTEEKNSIFECVFVYPIEGNLFSKIGNGKFIKIMCNNAPNMQIFRIYRHVGSERGTVAFYCEHISYLLNGVAVLAFSPENALIKCQDAFTLIQGYMRPWYSKWKLKAEIQDKSYFWGLKSPAKLREVLIGESYIMGVERWSKGEYEFDNYSVILHEHRGKQLNIILNYGQNIKSIAHDISIGDTCTHMLPYLITTDSNAKQDVVITLSEGNTFNPDSDALIAYPNSEKYKNKRVNIVDYSSGWSGGIDGAKEYLKTMAVNDIKYNKKFSENDSPTVKITIGYVDFLRSMEYSNLYEIDDLRLCDWVTLFYEPLRISVDIEIVRTVYDVLEETYRELGLSNSTEK